MLWLALIICLINTSLALLPTFGACPDVETIDRLNMTRFMGKWFEAERYFSLVDIGAKCGTFNYSSGDNGSLKLVNSQISTITGIESTVEGIARPLTRADDPKLLMSYPSLPIQYPLPYWILGTDYDTFAVCWSCTNMGVFSLKSAWILTREQKPPIPVLEKAYHILDKNTISRAYFSRTDQKNCPSVN
ncbi:apolipoprotein D-like [Aphidius gifuensis]|uniref:apolipoprotein D-like n=1 Tax=Aphidius gifuensis TaxID=684658 RepID=UPI001CDBC37A|nr:apolipoprotein D-like [Aphidius gifuensis]